jgi:hypothetical protein|tara:strand:+ start:19 stop:813 length:795 start_codon:yes stop_codon:yes gene_type:complete
VSTLKSSAENLTLNADGANNDIILQSNGSTKVTLDGQNGRVGIGTATPTDVLELDGTDPVLKIGNRMRLKADESNATGWIGVGTVINNLKIGDADFGDPKLTISMAVDSDVTVNDGDLIFGTAGKGIVLGATSNTDANTLDDYEEGTWTPSVSVGTASSSGTYTKVGNLVTVMGTCFSFSNYTNNEKQNITGLPFSRAGGGESIAGSAMWSYVDKVGSYGTPYLSGSTTLAFYSASETSNFDYIRCIDMTSNTTIYFSATYRAA